MPRRFPDYPREPDLMRWSDVPRIYWIAIGVTILLGLVTGSVWIAWKLFDIHVLPWFTR